MCISLGGARAVFSRKKSDEILAIFFSNQYHFKSELGQKEMEKTKSIALSNINKSEICEKKFGTKQNLKKHFEIHIIFVLNLNYHSNVKY